MAWLYFKTILGKSIILLGLANSDVLTKGKCLMASTGVTFPKAVQRKNHFHVPEGVSHQELLDSVEFNFILHNTQQ